MTGNMNTSLSPLTPESIGLRDGFGRPVPRQLLIFHTQAESGADYARDSSRFPRRRSLFIYPANRHRVSPEFMRLRKCVPMAFTRRYFQPMGVGKRGA